MAAYRRQRHKPRLEHGASVPALSNSGLGAESKVRRKVGEERPTNVSSEFGDGQDFEHAKIIVFRCSGERNFSLDSRQRGEMFEPFLRCARDIVL
jgi:hypothetical protein